jgi:hypothetical protein
LNGEGDVDLIDAIIGLQVLSGVVPVTDLLVSGDVNGDAKVGLEDVIYILQMVAGIRKQF